MALDELLNHSGPWCALMRNRGKQYPVFRFVLTMAENMGKGPGAECATQWSSGSGGWILVQMVLGSDLGRGSRPTALVARELLLSATQKNSGFRDGTALFFNTQPDTS